MTVPRKKLIEIALPLEDINREAAREKSIRHGHPSTLHLWWARRPLAACRAVLFASLVDDPSGHTQELLADGAKRRAAESVFKARKKVWQERKATFDKARGAGMTSVPDPGPEPTLEEIVAEQERERLFDIIRDLVKWENSNNERVLQAASAEILRSCNGKPPPVYDPFCGGGSIPLEAQRLGLEAHASDLNPVPVLITKALIEIPPKFAGKPPVNPESRRKLGASGSWKRAAGLAEDIRYYGQWVRCEAEKRIGNLYPKVKLPKEHGGGEATVIAWLWARTVASPDPAAKGAHVPLVRSFWLSTKAGKKAWVEPLVDQSKMTYRLEVRTGDGEPRARTCGRSGGVCLLTGSPIPLEYIRAEGKAGRLSTRLLAVVAETKRGRIYLPPSEEQAMAASVDQLDDCAFLDTELSTHPQYMAAPRYGLTTHKHLFTGRQLRLLGTCCDLVGQSLREIRVAAEAARLSSSASQEYAVAVSTYLGLCTSKLADYNCVNVTWSQSRDQAGHAFTKQALPFIWDFVEVNPFAEAAGDFQVSLEGIVKTVQGLPETDHQALVEQLSAVNLASGTPFVFSTDPPYYDNVPYADLSDFFYVWLRRALQQIYPALLGTLLVPKTEELVADQVRHGSRENARAFFETAMGQVFSRMNELSDVRFPTTIFYAFKQTEDDEDAEDSDVETDVSQTSTGWETMLQGLLDQHWQIEGTWPMRTERGARSRSIGSNALASSIVLVCRPRPKEAGVASRRDFLAALKGELPEALRNLQKGNIAPVDLAQAAIGPGMAVFSRYAKVMESDGSAMTVRAALAEINKCLDEVLAEQEGEFDADTRWALAWFDQHGFGEGPYGTAETLCTAKNTSVGGMAEAGILVAKSGKVRLLRKEELADDWDPDTDDRLTVWEIAHYLSRSLDQSESGAAALLKKLGSKGEVARDLAYRLYAICERRKWAKEALAYNALVLSWSDVTKLAQQREAAAPVQGEMI